MNDQTTQFQTRNKKKGLRLQKSFRAVKNSEKKTGGWLEIKADLCKECGLCVEACPVGVLKLSENLNIMGYHPVEYIGEGCTGCGICFYVCPEPGTFTVRKPSKVKLTN